MIERILNKIIRVGRVKAVYPNRGTVRVQFDDLSEMQSAELQVLMRRSQRDLDYDLFTLEEQVLCLFLPISKNKGYVIGSLYTISNIPQEFIDKKIFRFEDGSEISYDRPSKTFKLHSTSTIDISAVNNIDIKAININIEADSISVNAETININGGNISQKADSSFSMEAGGSMSIKAPNLSIDAVTTFEKAVTVSGALVAGGGMSTKISGSFDEHVHYLKDGVEKTKTPVPK